MPPALPGYQWHAHGSNGMTLYIFDKDVAGSGKERVQRPMRHQLAAPVCI